MTYDNYESEVYADEVDVLVYYHLRPLRQPTTPASLSLLQVLDAVVSELEATTAGGEQPRTFLWSRWGDLLNSGPWADDLNALATSYLPALMPLLLCAADGKDGESDQGRGFTQQLRLHVGWMNCNENALDWDWIPKHEQRFSQLVLHPAQPHKGHAEWSRRNVLWSACHTEAQHRIPDEFTFSPLFHPRVVYPPLDEFITWLHGHLRPTHSFDLDAALTRSAAYRPHVDWVRRGHVVTSQNYTLITRYAVQCGASALLRLRPHLAAVHEMGQLVGEGQRSARLQDVDLHWCQEHIPPVEELIATILSSAPMQAARVEWLQAHQLEIERTTQPAMVSPPAPPSSSPLPDNDSATPPPLTLASSPFVTEVRQVTTANFESLVFDASKDVVIGLCHNDANGIQRNLSLCLRLPHSHGGTTHRSVPAECRTV